MEKQPLPIILTTKKNNFAGRLLLRSSLYQKNAAFMFGLFKKKSEVEKLESKYQALLKEAHALSTSSRRLSDGKAAEADEVLKEIERLKAKQ